jgi:predicted PurR-regulated permease PerM
VEQAEFKLRGLKKSVEEIGETTAAVEDLANRKGSEGAELEVRQVTFTDRVFGHTQRLVTSGFIALILVYFLLASGDLFLRKVVGLLPRFRHRRAAVLIFRGIESSLSTYLLSITVINLILGACVALSFYFLEVPSPILWGVVAALLNYIPYIGALIGFVILLLVSIINFDSLAFAFVPPLVYLLLTGLEGTLLRPLILGRWLTLNPVAIFVAIVFWGWLWGAIGAILAVPVLMALKIVCDNFPWLRPIGVMLS